MNKQALCAVACMLLAQTANADGPGVHVGMGTNGFNVGYQTNDVAEVFGIKTSVEYGYQHWVRQNVTGHQIYLAPNLHGNLTERIVWEYGSGLSLIDRTRFGKVRISTAFQFHNHFGIGYKVTPDLTAGLRYTHASNAGIKEPNPGLDTLEFNLRWAFK